MSNRFRFLVIFLLVTIGQVASGQEVRDTCSCNVALNKDLLIRVRTLDDELSFLKIIDSKTFHELRSSASVDVEIPIVKGLLSASADFAEFEKRRTEYFERVVYDKSRREAEQILQQVTSPVAYRYWAECKSTCALQNSGFWAWKESENSKSMLVTVFWNPGPLRSLPIPLSGTVDGGV